MDLVAPIKPRVTASPNNPNPATRISAVNTLDPLATVKPQETFSRQCGPEGVDSGSGILTIRVHRDPCRPPVRASEGLGLRSLAPGRSMSVVEAGWIGLQ